jgi:hypothetical protein
MRSTGLNVPERIGCSLETEILLFFHSFASARRKRNFIKRLKDEDDNWVEGSESLKPPISGYFTELFTSEVQATDPTVLQKIQPKVDEEMNE